MKKIAIILLCCLTTPVFAKSKYDFSCKVLNTNIMRCENTEVICYKAFASYSVSLQCFIKTEHKE